MITRILSATDEAINEAAERIRSGELVAFPTETVYGLGADGLNSEAVARIFAAKGRPGDNPLILHIASMEQIEPLIQGPLSPAAVRMANAFWPGPLTMIFPKSKYIPENVCAGLSTVGIRFPVHPDAQRLIAAAGTPIAAPSANRSGKPSPTTAAHVFEDMNGRIPLILDGGECQVGVESTIVDMTGEIPHILRPGGITAEQIAQVVGSSEVDAAVMRPLAKGEKPRSPGMAHRHYAPNGQLTVFTGNSEHVIQRICAEYDRASADGHRPLILSLEGHIARYGSRRTESLGQDETAMAHRLFALLRDADHMEADILFAEGVEAKGVGLAVMNRLGRAAAFRIIEV